MGQAVVGDLTRSPSWAETILVAQLAAWIVFSLALGAAVSWVRAGAVGPDAMVKSLMFGSAIAVVPALLIARYRSRVAGKPFGIAVLTAAAILALACCMWGWPHSLARLSYALVLMITVLARQTRSEERL
jgi:hypothetical protein